MTKQLFVFHSLLALGLSTARGQEVAVTIEPAVELKIQTREGFRYDIEESATMSNFQPNGRSVEGSGETESLFFPVEGKRFFRAAEIPTAVRKLIAGLEIYSLNTARVSSDSGEIEITGARVRSRDYDEDDFATIRYCFDFPSQGFVPKSFEAITDVGPTLLREESFYPLNDPTEEASATFLGAPFVPGSAVTLNVPPEGGDVIISAKARQRVNYRFSSNRQLEFTVLDGDGKELSNSIFTGSGQLEGGFVSLENLIRVIRFKPLGTAGASVSFVYADGNRSGISDIAIGDSVSTGTMSLNSDYKKFRFSLEAGRRITLNGFVSNGGDFLLCKQNGETVDTFGVTGSGTRAIVLGPVEEAGEHFLVFFGRDFETNSFSGTINYFE